jgi:hypothetical protein
MKETARHLWHYVSRTWASKSWNRLLDWMARSRLAPMVKVGQTPQGVAAGSLGDARAEDGGLDGALDGGLVDVVAAELVGIAVAIAAGRREHPIASASRGRLGGTADGEGLRRVGAPLHPLSRASASR